MKSGNAALGFAAIIALASAPAGADAVLCSISSGGSPTGSRIVVNTSVPPPQPRYQLNAQGCAQFADADVPFFLTQGFVQQSGGTVALPPAGYTLAFNENFSTVSVSNSTLANDGSTWYTNTKACGCYTPTDGVPAVQYDGTGGQTTPFFLLGGGGLDIRLGKQTLAATPTWVGPTIASTAPNGVGFSFQYGYMETSVKFPVNQPGIWPAVWMLAKNCLPLSPGYPAQCPNDSSGAAAGIPELDLFEVFGAFPGYWTWTFHNFSRGVNDANMNTATAINLLDGNFHVIGLLWNATTTTMYVDGTIMFAIPTPPSYKQPLFILLSLGMGSGFPTDQTPNPSHMNVKYVHVYTPA